MVMRSDVNLAAILAAIAANAIYGGIVAAGPSAKWHYPSLFAAQITLLVRSAAHNSMPILAASRSGCALYIHGHGDRA
jgi:hypothetical protein